jgi:dolichol kinase
MSQRSRELLRKAMHVLVGTGCLLLGWFVLANYGSDALELSLAGVLAVLVLADILIADYGFKFPVYHHLQRPHEVESFHTATLAFISSIIVLKLFALPIAIASIAMLIYGDAAAAIVGIYTSKARKKTGFWRTFAMLAVSVAIGYFVFGWIGAVMGIVATLAECLVSKIDDAITIPIFAGLAGHILMLLFL